jgi:TPR repeat protein
MENGMKNLLLAGLLSFCAPQSIADDFEMALTALSEREYSTAYRAFKRLAKREHIDAQYQLGMLYLYGRGVDQDVEQGVSWLKRAAEGGSYVAANELGQVYLSGQWVKQNETEAMKWLTLSSKIAEESEGEASDGCE